MFLTIQLPEGVPKELVLPHYFLQEVNDPIFFWGIRILCILALVGSVISCIYYEKKNSKETSIQEDSKEEEDE